MTSFSRRNFLKTSAAAVAAVGFGGLVTRLSLPKSHGTANIYGALSPKASVNTGETFLALPDGFRYNVIGKAGSAMSDGRPTPVLHDGMGVFTSGTLPTSWIVVRNHENNGFANVAGSVTGTPPYDALAGGGTTNLIVDRQTRLVTSDFVSLSGTLRNCAGGATPWRTWISCEETTAGTSAGLSAPHGYCFEVQRLTESSPVPLRAMGRFRHEAVAFDRTTGVAYLTEDTNPAGFYRFIPNSYGNLAAGGKLQMLAVDGAPNFDTRTGQMSGTRMIATWVDIDEPDPADAESDSIAVYRQGAARGGATFARLEGCFAGMREIYFTSTNGGNAGLGQVWKYEPRRKSNFGHLTLVFESPNADVFDFPDNIYFGPNGGLFICEDGTVDNFVKVLAPDGTISPFVKNIVPGFETYELTGGVFSPDLSTFFVNAQTPGLTFAIWGPF